jgi:hypothetical protein
MKRKSNYEKQAEASTHMMLALDEQIRRAGFTEIAPGLFVPPEGTDPITALKEAMSNEPTTRR